MAILNMFSNKNLDDMNLRFKDKGIYKFECTQAGRTFLCTVTEISSVSSNPLYRYSTRPPIWTRGDIR